MTKKNIIFVTDESINSLESTSVVRILELSKALIQNDNSIYIFSLTNDNKNFTFKKIFKNYSIYLVGKPQTDNRNYFLKRYLCHFEKLAELNKVISFFSNDTTNTLFIVYNFFSTIYDEYTYVKILKQNGFKVIVEKNEIALGIALIKTFPNNIFKKILFFFIQIFELINSFFIDRHISTYDGFIVITREFERYIKSYTNRPIIRIPILTGQKKVDPNQPKSNSESELRVGYCGTINFKRDQIGKLLEAVFIVNSNSQEKKIRLSITGKGSKEAVKKLLNIVREKQMEQYIDYLGFLSKEELRKKQNEQDILVALRNNSLQGKFSFATKIADYMHLGKIVLVSNVSDNKLYIKNGKNGFLLKNNSADLIAKKIQEISNIKKSERLKIAENARNTAMRHFYFKNYKNDIKKFLEQIYE